MMVENMRPGDSVKLGSYRLPLPRSRLLRIAIGGGLVLLGLLGFLPILGFWMIPLGLLVLSGDIPRVRRWRRRFAVWFARTYPATAMKLGIRSNGNGAGTRPSPIGSLGVGATCSSPSPVAAAGGVRTPP